MLYQPTVTELRTLAATPMLTKLAPEALEAVVEAATLYAVNHGGFFFHQGERATSLYVLVDGQVRLSQIAEDGRQVIFHYFAPGEAIGVVVVLAGVVYPVSAEAMTDTIALGWDRQTAQALMEQYPQMAINGMELVAHRFWELQSRYRELATERVEQRLARAILRLAAYTSEHNGRREETVLRLSRQDLAEMTGTTLYSVSRICRSWQDRGILGTARERITILNEADLVAIAEDCQPADT